MADGSGSERAGPVPERGDKACRKCGETKPLTEFYRDRSAKDGLTRRCKACVTASRNAWNAANPDKRRENRRRYREANPENERVRQARGAEGRSAAKRRWNAENKEARKAHRRVQTEIETGRMVRPSTCDGCGRTCKPAAHHDDYSKPLDVRWLCIRCHRNHHAEEARNA